MAIRRLMLQRRVSLHKSATSPLMRLLPFTLEIDARYDAQARDADAFDIASYRHSSTRLLDRLISRGRGELDRTMGEFICPDVGVPVARGSCNHRRHTCCATLMLLHRQHLGRTLPAALLVPVSPGHRRLVYRRCHGRMPFNGRPIVLEPERKKQRQATSRR